VIIYGHRSFPLNVPEFLRTFGARLAALPALPAHDTIVDLLVDFGEAYSAAADAAFPSRDDTSDPLRAWSDAAHSLARSLVDSWHADRESAREWLRECRRSIDIVQRTSRLRTITANTAEGFAYYGLYPEQYLLAAGQFVRERSPQEVICIGIRNIGAILAHVVAGAIERLGAASRVITVRPRGHPFDRRLHLSDRLRDELRNHRSHWFAVVDEGPGLSGSSFAAATDALHELGTDASRIVLLPGWRAPLDALGSDRGRRALEQHSVFVGSFDDVFCTDGTLDMSAGQWRNHLLGHERSWPAVQPQHERRKYLTEAEGPFILRFAGLGRHGRSRLNRARRFADAGFGVEPVHLENGFLTLRWIDGDPQTAASMRSSTYAVDRTAEYIALVGQMFRRQEVARVGEIIGMMQTNVREALGDEASTALDPLASEAQSFEEPAVAIDGRMLPHEWILSGDRLWKVDALDHHADDFFTGERDIAWDVAGAIVELDLADGAASALVDAYRSRSRDRTIAKRLPFYQAAYLAYRLGYATMAAESLNGTDDGVRFTELQTRYRRSLATLAARPRPVRRR
jgi:hypothetical protein